MENNEIPWTCSGHGDTPDENCDECDWVAVCNRNQQFIISLRAENEELKAEKRGMMASIRVYAGNIDSLRADLAVLTDAAKAMLAERDRMVESGNYNDLAGVAHILRVRLTNNVAR